MALHVGFELWNCGDSDSAGARGRPKGRPRPGGGRRPAGAARPTTTTTNFGTFKLRSGTARLSGWGHRLIASSRAPAEL
jgi:hypothetical protein